MRNIFTSITFSHKQFTLLTHVSIILLLLGLTEANYYYFDSGKDWDGQCVNGTLQSPIDIPEDLFRNPLAEITDEQLHGLDI